MRLKDKVAIITGGASGMGAAHVRRFVKEGANVVFTDILEKEGEALALEVGENARFIRQDVTKSSEWEKVVAETNAVFGRIDILVNNAAILLLKPLEEVTEEEYRKVVDINQVSVFLGMKAVLPLMRKARSGSVVNISSASGINGNLHGIAYNASKFAVRGMTKVAALEYGEYGVRINSIHPGVIRTPMTIKGHILDNSEEVANSIPLRRVSEPEEVTNLVLYLASDESSFSTGSEFIVDGGTTAQ